MCANQLDMLGETGSLLSNKHAESTFCGCAWGESRNINRSTGL